MPKSQLMTREGARESEERGGGRQPKREGVWVEVFGRQPQELYDFQKSGPQLIGPFVRSIVAAAAVDVVVVETEGGQAKKRGRGG